MIDDVTGLVPTRGYLPAFASRARSPSLANTTRPSCTMPITTCSRRNASCVWKPAGSHFENGFYQVEMTPCTGSFRSSSAAQIFFVSVLPACFTAAAKRYTAS